MILDDFDNHYESLEKIIEEKAEKKYLTKKMEEVCKSISWDLSILGNAISEAKSCVAHGRKLYNYYINPTRHLKNIEDIVVKDRTTLDKLMDSCETSLHSVVEIDREVSNILDKLSVLDTERGRVMARFGMLKSLITPKLSILEVHISDMEKTSQALITHMPIELKAAETSLFVLNGLIHVS